MILRRLSPLHGQITKQLLKYSFVQKKGVERGCKKMLKQFMRKHQ